jgi:hypothetical protein
MVGAQAGLAPAGTRAVAVAFADSAETDAESVAAELASEVFSCPDWLHPNRPTPRATIRADARKAGLSGTEAFSAPDQNSW